MFSDNYICAVDISSSKIACVAARLKKGRIAALAFETAPSKGVREGVVVDSVGLVGELGSVLRRLKEKSGIPIKSVYTNISGQNITTRRSRAIIPLAERGNKVVTASDIQRVNEQARILGSSLEEEIIHAFPCSYTLDAKDNIINPLGLYSHRIEVELFLVCGKISSIQSLIHAVNQAGYEVGDMFFPGIAQSRVVFQQDSRDGVQVLCDIGSDMTELLVFDNGLLKEIQILPIGGDSLTARLAEGLAIPLELAEDVKRSYASIGTAERIEPDKEILIKRDASYVPIKQKAVAEILTERTRSLCVSLREALEKTATPDKVRRFTASGRSVLLDGFLEMLESTLNVSVRLGRIIHPSIAPFVSKEESLSGRKYLTYLSALGIVAEVLHERERNILTFTSAGANPLSRALNRIREIYQEYF